MASTLYRTVLVGIGSTGCDIVERIKRELEMRYPSSPAGVPFVTYMVIEDAKCSPSSPLGPNEHFRLDAMGMPQYLEERSLRDPKFVEGLGLPRGTSLQFGTRTSDDLKDTRLGWHLVFEREQDSVCGALLNQLERLFQSSAWGRPEDKGFVLEPGTQIDVYVVAGIDEMFGSSVVLDFLELLQHLPFFRKRDHEYRTTVVLTTLNGLSDAESGASTYAALSELNVKLIGDLTRELPKDKNAYYFARTPIYEACYLVEATDERTVPLEHGEDRLEMVIEWLAQSITHPASYNPNTATFSRVVRAFGSDIPNPNLPYYSGLVHVAYVVPRAELNQMFAGRYGQEVLGEEGLLSPPPGPTDAQKRVNDWWRDHELDPDKLVNFDSEQTRITPLALDVGKQQRAITLFTQDALMPRRLARWRQAIDRQVKLQDESYMRAYQAEVANQLHDVLIPRWERALTMLVREAADAPLGGLCALQGTLAVLKTRFEAAQIELEVRREKARTKYETFVEQANQVADIARNALRNTPSWILLLKFIGWTLATALPVIGFLLWWIVRDLRAADALTAFSIATAIRLLSDPILWCVGVMSMLCAARYLWELGVGSWRAARHGHNLPGWTTLGYILAGIPVSAAICGWLLYRLLSRGELSPLMLLATASYARSLALRGLGGIAAVGIISAGWFAFWHVHAIRRIRTAALTWVRFQEKVAAQEAVLYRARKAKKGYQELSDKLNDEIAHWEECIQRVENATERLKTQYEDAYDVLYGRERRFRRLAVQSDRHAHQLYTTQVLDDAKRETQEFFAAIELPFLTWLKQPVGAMVATFNDYIMRRFEPYWADHDLSGLIKASAPGAVSFSEAVQRALDWITRYRPQWSYHAGGTGRSDESGWEVFGELRMSAGVGDEDDRDLHTALKAFRKVTGKLSPIVYPTGDRYELSITIKRRDLPLEELHEIFKYRTDYLAVRDSRLGLDRPGRRADVISEKRLRMYKARREREAAAAALGPADDDLQVPELDESGKAPVTVPKTGPERDKVRAVLNVKKGASREKVQAAFERVQRDLVTARDGLLNTMKRYRHYAQAQQGVLTGPSWYDLLGLPVDRGVTPSAVEEAYTRRQALLLEVYNELLADAAT